MEQVDRIIGGGESAARRGRDPVNQPMVNNWVEAIGDTNPVYVDGSAAAASSHGEVVAPPAMAQVWTMGGLKPLRDPADPLYATMSMLDEEGYTSVLATNCEQSYSRYLRIGDEVSVTTRLESVVGPKRTAVGDGYFVTTRNNWYVADEQVATMLFRVLKFQPRSPSAVPGRPPAGLPSGLAALDLPPDPTTAAPAAGPAPLTPTAAGDAWVLRPQVNRDTEFFWEGIRRGELRIQSCGSCGTLRHPPGPMCPSCHATAPLYIVATGRGTVYSYVVHRHPPLPGRQLPVVLALVELEEGVRMVGELLDVSPDEVEIGTAVTVSMVRVDEALALPAWRRSDGAHR